MTLERLARLEQVVGFFNFLFLQAPKLRDFFGVDTASIVKAALHQLG